MLCTFNHDKKNEIEKSMSQVVKGHAILSRNKARTHTFIWPYACAYEQVGKHDVKRIPYCESLATSLKATVLIILLPPTPSPTI